MRSLLSFVALMPSLLSQGFGQSFPLPALWTFTTHDSTTEALRNAGRVLPSPEDLEDARRWLWRNPPDGKNKAERRERMLVIQSAASQMESKDFQEYRQAWKTDPRLADEMEKEGALHYLSIATDQALNDIRRKRVRRGLAVWHIYNMGFVFKSPEACFGVDLVLRDAKRLARDLDFLLVTHEHRDHYSKELLDAMIASGKPVVTRWYPGSTIVNVPSQFHFGSTRVKIDVGDHPPDRGNAVLMFQIDCGASPRRRTIYHTGDGCNVDKIQPDRPVDILILHIQCGLPLRQTIRRVNPRFAVLSHLMELGHSFQPPNPWRFLYEYAFRRAEGLPSRRALVLSWGERWTLPGTILESIYE